ncbi:MAG: hypothetical protein LBH25_04230 [Fibromonadaceae bacterium]|jgi:hypothetical protein|nr:hypothetical protein [Fibromonadaceae bacterium]
MLKHFCVLSVVCIFLACSESGNKGQNEDGAIKLFLGKLEVPMFDSISVRISASDMSDIHISERNIKDNLKIDGVPYGENREFEVKIYADSGKLVQKGEASADLIVGETHIIPISLVALAGFLRLEVPLGIPNNTGIHSGKLFLGNLQYNMKFETGKGVFSTNSMSLDEVFEIEIELYDSKGEVLFIGNKTLSLSSIVQTETIQLQSTKGQVILELQASSDKPSQVLAMLPESSYGYRKPENFGDLFFTEIFAYPKTSGQDFEYMEIYNITLDTLLLSGCRIAENETSSTTTKRLNMPKNLILPPMEYLFFGRDSVVGADFNYKTFHLLTTGQSLGFFCEDLVIDTIAFYAKGENLFPLEKGRAMQLPLANYQNRTQGSSWCFGSSPKSDAMCP